MALQIATVTASIAALTVTGLTIKDMDEIPSVGLSRNCPVVFPDEGGFVQNFVAEKAAFGEGSGSAWNVNYDLRYVLLYGEVGTGRGQEKYGPTISMAFAFMDAILTCNPQAGAVLIRPGEITNPGLITDPAGKQFMGCQITVHVLEFVN